MKRFTWPAATLAVVLTAALGVLVGTSRADDGTGIYSYSAAVSAGLVPTSSQYNSELDPATCVPEVGYSCSGPSMYCTNNGSTDGGYSSESALESAIAAAPDTPTCQTDPRTISYGTLDTAAGANPTVSGNNACSYVNYPQGKCWDGQSSVTKSTGSSIFTSKGIEADIEYSDPTGITTTNGEAYGTPIWIYPHVPSCHLNEVGYLKSSNSMSHFGDNMSHVYAAIDDGYGSGNCGTGASFSWYQYVPTAGNYYAFRIIPVPGGVQDEIFWAGGWQTMGGAGKDTDFSCVSGGSSTCEIETGSEAESNYSNTGWPAPNAGAYGAGTNFTNVQRDGSSGWANWSSSIGAYTYDSSSGPVYLYCGITSFTQFRTPKQTSCSGS